MTECRCDCGALLARRIQEGIELKCRRCKRVWRLGFNDFSWREAESSSQAARDRASRAPQRGELIPLT